jgi:MFS family permease
VTPGAAGGSRFARNALLLWAGQLVAAGGEALFLPAVAWLAGRSSGTSGEVMVGVTVALATAPFLLFGPLAGALVDRWDRRRLMVASALLRAAVLLVFALVAAGSGRVEPAVLVAAAFLLGTFATPFQPARDALLPDLLEGRPAARWNAVVQTSAQVAQIVGLALGAFLLAGSGGADAERARVVRMLGWNGAAFLVSAGLLSLLRPPAAALTRATKPLGAALAEGLGHAARDPVVRGLLVVTALDNLAIMGPAIVGAALLVQRTYELGPESLAAFEGAMAVGMLLGSLLLALRGDRVRLVPLLFVGMTLDGLTYLPFFWLADYHVGLAAIALHGVCIPFIVVARTSLLQQHVPPERRGQVFALVAVTVAGMTALSALLSGWAAAAFGPRALFLGAGALGAACGVVGAVWLGPRLARAARAHGS